MRRVFVLLSILVVAGLLLWTAQPQSQPRVQPHLQPQTPSCKPEAPIAVTLAVPDDGAAGVVRAAFSMRPVLELANLHWSWELSQDVRLVEGAEAGVAAPQRGVLTEGEVRLQLPNDGLHHTAKLVVTGELRGAGAAAAADAAADADVAAVPAEPELVTVVRTLSWGEPEPVTPTVLSPDADTGMLVKVAVVPTTHVPAPAPLRAGGR